MYIAIALLSILYINWSSGQRLIEAFVGVPASIELLDLSHNDITNIDDACFSVSIFAFLTLCHIAYKRAWIIRKFVGHLHSAGVKLFARVIIKSKFD